MNNQQWEKAKRKGSAIQDALIIVQWLRWFGRLHMRDREAINEGGGKNVFPLLKSTSLSVQHAETSLVQRHQFKMAAIKQDMWLSS